MGLLGRWRPSFIEVVAILGMYCVIASSASQDSFYANNNHLDELVKSSNKKHINIADITKDPSLAQDFPEVDVLSHILPLVTFECKGKQPGYFADHKFRCEIFHFCKQDGTRSTYACPFKSRFNQENGACEDEQTVQCDPAIIESALGTELREVNHKEIATSTSTKNTTSNPKKRVARQAIFQQNLPQNTRFIPGSNVLFIPQNPDTGFVRFLVPQQQQQPLFQLNSQFAPAPTGQPTQTVQVQQPATNIAPSTSGLFVQSPSTHRAPTIIHADNVQQSSARQGQVLQQRPLTSGNTFGNQHRLPSSGLSLIRQDVPVSRPQAATFQNQQRPLQSRPSQPVASFGNQQQRPSTGSTFTQQQRPQPQVANLGNQQRPPSTSFLSQPRQVPQGPQQGFDQRRPPNQFGPEFFDDGFPGPSPFFQGGPPRFVAQNTRPQIAESNNGGPGFGILGQPQTPEGFFFAQPPFQHNPNLDEDFFNSDFPQLNLGPPQRPPQRPQHQNEPRPPQQQVGNNFNLSPEDNAFINEIRFPGPPQGHRVVTDEPPKGPATGRPTENDQRPQRPQRPPPGFSQPDSGERGHAQFPSRFPPEHQSNFGFQPEHDQRPPPRDQRPPQEDQRPPQEDRRPPQEDQRPPQEDQRPPQRDQRPPQRDQRPPQRDQRPPQRDQRPPQRDQRPPQGNQRPPQRDQRPPQRDQRPPQAQFPSGPFFEPPEAPEQPPRRPVPQVPSPPRRPSPSIDPTTQRNPTRPPPHQRRPQFNDANENGQDDRRFTASPARPLVTSTPSSSSKPTRGRGKFRPHQGDGFDFSDQGQDNPQRGPEIEDEAPHRPVSAEAFGIPDPSEDFGSREPQFQSSTPRRPATHQRRPPASPQFFSANPSRPVEISTPPTAPLRRPTTEQPFTHQPSSGQRFRPNHQSESSNEENQRGQSQHAPNRQPSNEQRFPSRDPSTEGVQNHRGQSPHTRPFHFEKPSTEHPADFFSSQQPTFSTSHGTSSEVPDHGNPRPGQNFPNFFSPNENNFGESDFSDGNFRRPFSHTTEGDRGHGGQPNIISSTQPSFHDNFNPFLQQNAGDNRDTVPGPTFSDANIPSSPTFGPQSADQLAPPDLTPFTTRPDTPGPTDVTEGVQGGHVQRGRHPTTSNPRQFGSTHPKDISSPADVSSSTELSATAPTKRGRRPGSVASTVGSGIRTRPTRKRGRGRRPTTPGATADISNDVTTTAKPRRRVRPASGAIRKRPIAQRGRAQATSSTEAPKSTLAEASTSATVSKRRPVGKRVQAGNQGNSRAVVRRRRPVSTTTATSAFPSTVDHSASVSREQILSSDSTNRKVTIVSKLDAVQDSAISASHERFTVTKADFQDTPETSSIKDHSSIATSTEAIELDRSTSASPTTSTTSATTAPQPSETESTNEISSSSPSAVTVTKVTTTSTTSSSADSKPEALTKLKLLLNRKFILKLTTEAPSS